MACCMSHNGGGSFVAHQELNQQIFVEVTTSCGMDHGCGRSVFCNLFTNQGIHDMTPCSLLSSSNFHIDKMGSAGDTSDVDIEEG